MSRITPFELAFGSLTDELDRLRTEALEQDKDPSDQLTFVQLPAVQSLLNRIAPPSVVEGDAGAVAEYLNLLYVGYRFWNAGGRVIGTGRAEIEAVLDHTPPQGPPPIPHGTCYLQLPEQLFWAQVADEAPHEPIDGFFAVQAPHEDGVTLLAVLGLRTERDGFSQICLSVTSEDLVAAHEETREDRFAPVMDGGTLSGFHSITSAAELILLSQLVLLQERGSI
jgi:hypothetical protein